MNERRWLNQSHPQTLRLGVVLLYIDAFFIVISGAVSLLGILLAVAAVGAGFGIANDRRAAWYLGVAVSAIVPLVLISILVRSGIDELFDVDFLIAAAFPVAQLVALVHPTSRAFVKTWFE